MDDDVALLVPADVPVGGNEAKGSSVGQQRPRRCSISAQVERFGWSHTYGEGGFSLPKFWMGHKQLQLSQT